MLERALRRLLGTLACVVAARCIQTAAAPTQSVGPAHATTRSTPTAVAMIDQNQQFEWPAAWGCSRLGVLSNRDGPQRREARCLPRADVLELQHPAGTVLDPCRVEGDRVLPGAEVRGSEHGEPCRRAGRRVQPEELDLRARFSRGRGVAGEREPTARALDG